MPTPYDNDDAMTGNGKKTKAVLGIAIATVLALLGRDISKLKKEERSALERAAVAQQNSQDSLAGKPIKTGRGRKRGKGNGKDRDVFEMYGDHRDKFADEPLLTQPNSNSMKMGANF